MTGPDRPNRRATDRGPLDSPRARMGRVVRHIAADPVLVGWLATTKARTLHDVAAQLVEHGHREAAELVRQYGDDLTSGKRSPLG